MRGTHAPQDDVAATFASLGRARSLLAGVQVAAPHLSAPVHAPAPAAPVADAVLFAVSAGDGNDDAILRVGDEGGAATGSGLARLFAGNPDFHNLVDIALDVDAGFYFVVDSDFSGTNRILRGDIADLTSGTATPSLTEVFATDNFDNGADNGVSGEGIVNIEIDPVGGKIYWLDGDLYGDFEGGFQLNRANYDGSDVETVATIDSENPDPVIGFPGGVGDFAIDRANGVAYVVAATAGIDGLGEATAYQNHILRIDLSTGAVTFLDLGSSGVADGYHDGRLDPTSYGQIATIDVDQATGRVYFATQPLGQDDHGGVFAFTPGATSGDLVDGTLATLWVQPADSAYTTPQSFPTSLIQGLEFDEVSGRYFLTAGADASENNASIFVGDPAGGAPSLFQQVTAPTDVGSPFGMEIDHASTLALTGAGATYVENDAAVSVIASATLTDPDNATLKGATVTITSGYLAGDALVVDTAGTAITATATAGVLTLSGSDTLANYQAVIASLTFSASGDDPTNGGSATSRTISITTFDGLVSSEAASVTVAVTSVNDAPATADAGTTINEDGVYVFGLADFAFADVEGNTAVALVIRTVPANGTLVFDDGTTRLGLGAGEQVDFADIQAGHLRFEPDANFNGTSSFDFAVTDDGGTADGGQDVSADATFTVTVDAVIDPPVATDDPDVVVAADATVTFDVRANDTDVDGIATVVAIGSTTLSQAGDVATLASGATVTLEADGTLTYAAGAGFDFLVSAATAALARATNAQATDSFDYSLNGGSTATVTVTVDGVDGPGDVLLGSAGDDRMRPVGEVPIDGGAGSDTLQVTPGQTLTPAAGSIRNFELIAVAGTASLDLGAFGQSFGLLASRSEASESAHIAGTQGDDRIVGGAGADELSGGAGDDQILISAAPGLLDGGAGDRDVLVVREGAQLALTDATFTGFEIVRVDEGANLDLSAVTQRLQAIRLNSDAGGGAEVHGTSVRDHIAGGLGNDVIAGGGGADVLTGGGGADTFVYAAPQDIGVSFRETITDFQSGVDTIDLSAIDPDRRLAGDQAFTFIGGDAFTGKGGTDFEVRVEAVGNGNLRVEFDVNHDGAVDYGLTVHAAALQASDFIL